MFEDNEKPVAIILVGIPGSGKSTFYNQSLQNYPRVSSDYFIEKWAAEEEKTYNEVFTKYVDKAISELNKQVTDYVNNNVSFVWDQTNIAKAKRQTILRKIPDNYFKVAIEFVTPLEVCIERNAKRDRSIPSKIIESMFNNIQPVEMSEGFDTVVTRHNLTDE